MVMSVDSGTDGQRSGGSISAAAAAWLYGVFVVLLCAVIVLLALYGPNFWDNWAVLRYWRWVVPLVPVVLVIQQALFVVYIKRPSIRAELTGGRSQQQQSRAVAQSPRSSFKTRADLGPARSKAISEFDSYLSTVQVFVHYLVAAVLLAAVGIMLIYVCCDPPDCLQGQATSVVHEKVTLSGKKMEKSASEEHESAGPAITSRENAAAPQVGARPLQSSEGPPRPIPRWTKDGKSDDNRRVAASPRPADRGGDDQHVAAAATTAETKRADESLPEATPPPGSIQNNPRVNAFRVGAAGALIYVLTYLGRRTFQRDITAAAALWCSVQLVLGPVLAYTIAYFLVPAKQDAGSTIIDFSAIYFLAGLSPRLIADWVTSTVQRLWLQSAATVSTTPRAVSLTQIRGIMPSTESRLNEEGIENVAQLALANPIKLLRNTPFDPRQIVGWIDEAILMTTLPDQWVALQKEGVTGAIDLAWYLLGQFEGEVGAPTDGPASLRKLAASLKMEPESLYNVALRLLYDDQVEMLWAIYESNGALEPTGGA